MALYTVLVNFTDQGVRAVKDTTHRAEAVEGLARKMGVTVKGMHWTLGAYDMVCQFEAPDDATLTAFGLAITSQGNVRTQSLRSFTRDEMNGILSKLPA